MASFTLGMGKGLREPCPPYREAYVFGAELGEPDVSNWNCIPAIVNPTTNFDLTALSLRHEVVVVLLGVSKPLAGDYTIRFEWYRERDNALLYEYTGKLTILKEVFIYAFSYIAYAVVEIIENGSYRVEVTLTGPLSYERTINFTVSGIPELPLEPAPSTNFMPAIIEQLNRASGFFYSAYLEAISWVYPFFLIGGAFYALSSIFNDLAWRFYDFALWVYDISGKIGGILDYVDIWAYFDYWFNRAAWAWDWVLRAFDNVWDIVDDWWSSTSLTVLSWIDEAKQWTQFQIDYLQGQVNELREMIENIPGAIPDLSALLEWFIDWRTHVSKTIIFWWRGALTEVQDLINSAFTVRESLWAGWQEWRESVAEFFADPLEWLWDRFTNWFLGPEV